MSPLTREELKKEISSIKHAISQYTIKLQHAERQLDALPQIGWWLCCLNDEYKPRPVRFLGETYVLPNSAVIGEAPNCECATGHPNVILWGDGR